MCERSFALADPVLMTEVIMMSEMGGTKEEGRQREHNRWKGKVWGDRALAQSSSGSSSVSFCASVDSISQL